MAIVAAGIIIGYDWTSNRRFQVRLDLYSYTSEHSASGVLTPETFSIEDEDGFVNAKVYVFVHDYITASADDGGWEMVLAAGDSIEIINPYTNASEATVLSSKFSAYWNMTEEAGNQREDSVGSNGGLNRLSEAITVSREATSDGSWAALFDGVGGGWLVVPGVAISFGDLDFALTLWAKYTDHAAEAPILTIEDTSPNQLLFELVRRTDTGMLEFRAYNGATIDSYTSTFHIDGSGSVWNFIALWYEAATDTVRIQVNAETVQTFVLTTPLQSGNLVQGYVGHEGTAHFNGAIRRLGYGLFNPTVTERAILFNNGQGQDWPLEQPVFPPTPSGTGYALITDGVQAETAGNIDADYIGAHDIIAGHDGFPGGSTTFLRADSTFATPAAAPITMSFEGLILGRVSVGEGPVEELYVTQALDMLGGAADGDMIVRIGGYWGFLPKGLAGHVLTMNGGATAPEWDAAAAAAIADGSVTYAKIQDVSAADKILGSTFGAGDVEEISCTLAARGFLEVSTAGDQRAVLGLGGLATLHTVGFNEIDNGSVYYSKMQWVSDTDKVLGRSGAGSGEVQEIACTAAGRALLDDAAASDQRTTLGLGAMAEKATVATGDIDADSVTYAKLQNVSATDRLLGRDTVGAGDVEEIAPAAVLAMLGAFSNVTLQAFTTVGANTYTPTAGMKSCIVISTGSGGGGGGADTAGGSADVGVGGGGGAGGTCIEAFSAATIGASQTVTIGVAGTVGSATNGTAGGAGGNTTFGALHTANGGAGGTGSGASAVDFQTIAGGAGGVPTGGLANITGGSGGAGNGSSGGTTITIGEGGDGGASFWGGGGGGGRGAGIVVTTDVNAAGGAGLAYGSGGGGACSLNSTTGAAGGIGMLGFCLVIELG